MSGDRTNPLGPGWGDEELDQTIAPPGAQPEPETGTSTSAALTLSVLSGSRAGQRISFAGPEVLVGRRPRNHLVLDGPADKIVSGYHLRIERREGAWWVEDRNSTNGTLLNGTQLEVPVALQDGDLIELGRRRKGTDESTIRLRVELAEAGAAPSPDPAQGLGTISLAADPGPRTVGHGAPDDGHSTVGAGPATAHSSSTRPPEPPARPSPKPAPPAPKAAPPPPPPAAPAARPAGLDDVRERLRAVHKKSVRLGQVSGRLEGLLESLRASCLEGREVDLGSLAAADALRQALARRAGLEVEVSQIGVQLSVLAGRMEQELQPLDAAVVARSQAAEQAREELERARRKAKELDERFSTQYGEARAALEAAVGELVKRLGAPSSEAGAPWNAWRSGLEEAAAEAGRRAPGLDAALAARDEAEQQRQALASQAATAAKEHEDARTRAQARRTELRTTQDRLESRAVEARAELEGSGALIEQELSGLLEHHFRASSSPLASLAPFAEARTLWNEAEGLKAEIAALDPDLL